VLLLWAGFTGFAGPVAAQTSTTGADLAGIVVDQTDAILPQTSVTVVEIDTNLTRTVSAGANGRFAVLALAPGSYRLRAERPGFRPYVIEDLHLALGAVMDLKLTLEIGGRQEAMTITTAAPLVDPRNTSVSHVVSQTEIDALPIDRRSFIGFTIITPGVSTDRIPQPSQGSTPTSGLTFAGQRPRSNNVMVDGLDSNASGTGAVRSTISLEAVHEFQVLSNSFSAEFGNASGGVVNIVTKSGGNVSRGNAFYFGRHDALSAKGYFEQYDPFGRAIDQPKAPFKQNQFGGVLGGPLKKDGAFYFVSFERLDTTASNFVTIDDRTPVFHPFTGEPLGTPAEILRRAGFTVATGNVPYAVQSNQFLLKTEQQITPRQHLTLRFNEANSYDENTEAFGGLIAKSRAGAVKINDHDVAAAHAWVMSGTTVNELRLHWVNRPWSLIPLDPACNGECDRDDEGGPTLEVLGVANVGRQRTAPGRRDTVMYQAVDAFTHVQGAHQIKGGVDFRFTDTPTYHLPLTFGGRYVFTALPATPGVLPAPVSAIQAVALGVPATYVQGYGNPGGAFEFKELSLFSQDDWRIAPRVTLKLGVRYQKQFWPNISYDVPGFPTRYTFPADNNNVAPRVAVAWDPTGDRGTSVHGAYGVFYADHINNVAPITSILDGNTGVKTLALRFPRSIPAWNAPDRRLLESAVGAFPSVRFAIDPALKTPYAHQISAGVDREIGHALSASADFVYVRGFNELGTIDYNPLVPELGAGRRPEDVNGVAGTSAAILQYTSFGETWYRGLMLSLKGRFNSQHQFFASYTLSKATDNSTDFQSAFVVQDTGKGRDRNNPYGLPVGFNPDGEKATSLQDQRHRFVLSGFSRVWAGIQASWIFTAASGRPYNILAGADLNGDGDGGAFPSDRARRDPADPSTSLPRDSGQLPFQTALDLRISRRFGAERHPSVEVMVEAFNLFNRTNFTEANNIFGRGSYPTQALPTYGLFEQAAAPRQIQLGVRMSF
jgi:hypothetical protein